MKKGIAVFKPKAVKIILSVFLCLTLCPGSEVRAADAWVKAGRGLSNVVTGFYEIPYQMQEAAGEGHDLLSSGFIGIVKGTFRGATRMVVGVFEVATFPFPIPWGYGPVIHPEFIVPPVYPDREIWPRYGEREKS